MKAITEALIRLELKDNCPEVYYIPEGKILSPAAREYLNQQQIAIDFERNREKREAKAKADAAAKAAEAKAAEEKVVIPKVGKEAENTSTATDERENITLSAKYIDFETGAGYMKKPEHMTQLHGNVLVDKDHPRILFRGRLDMIQAEVVCAQAMIKAAGESQLLLDDLDNILWILREMMKCEVLDEPFTNETIIGFTHSELRERSHAPMKFYKVEYMKLPDYTMGVAYALLNKLRAAIREVEVVAVSAFKDKRKMERSDIIEELNRLSSALHIMMCKYLAGEYKEN